MKPISARAKYNPKVIERLFSSADRARDTATKILAARSSTSGRFESHGLTLSTDRKLVAIGLSKPKKKPVTP